MGKRDVTIKLLELRKKMKPEIFKANSEGWKYMVKHSRPNQTVIIDERDLITNATK